MPLILQEDQKTITTDKHYENDKMCVQFIESISFIIERKVLENIKKSEYYSLLIDETMDISKKEQLIIYAKYFDYTKNKFQTSFLKVTPLENQNGAQIFLKVKDYLFKNGLDIRKCMAFGCDGAANLTGYRNGVYSHLIKSNPFLILRHCANHRLALAHTDTKSDVKYINEYVDIIADIYSFFSRSARRNILLKKFQAETLEPELHVLKMCPTRWLSLSNCVKNISRMLQSLVLTFDEELNSTDITMTAESRKRYEDTFVKVCEYKFIAMTFFLLIILGIIDKLCLSLQSDELNYENYANSVNTCFEELKQNYVDSEVYGDNFRVFKEKIANKKFSQHIVIIENSPLKKETEKIIKEFSKSLYQNLKSRFIIDEIVLLLQILVIENIIKNEEDISLYGISQMDKLLEIFGVEKNTNNLVSPPIIDLIETRIEWRLFKRLILNNYSNWKNKDFWSEATINSFFKLQYPNMRKLGYIANILPLSTAVCERGFSTLNLIKDEQRNKLGKKKLLAY